ncbi:MAG: biotin--[acetyl-CoA-carboxylase] ligase [Micropruina sp.]|uniref:biotin--[acetyl-CoA-carboxylase] ligase n=1 Tax=Micropruina sp. TaxID=2737536 RepID=UPI0039E29B78
MTAETVVDPAALRTALSGPGRLFTEFRCVPTTGSTNADLAAAARAGAASGTVLVADHQSAGRGRFDRRWEAPPGASVAVSVLLRPGGVSAARWLWLPLITGIAVAEGLAAVAGVDAEIKWPNDVLVGGRKVCGILAERVDDGAVIGMGINTALGADQLPVPTATSLRLAGSDASATAVVIGVLTALEAAYRRWSQPEDLRDWYGSRCSTVGREVRVLQPAGGYVEGRAAGVDAGGRLLVWTASGERAFAAGDVLHLR